MHDLIRVGTWCVGGIESKPDTLDVLLYNEVMYYCITHNDELIRVMMKTVKAVIPAPFTCILQ